MITRNFEDFPEHRLNFFRFLKAVNTHCFATIFVLPQHVQKLVVDSIIWAFKHTERNVAETGLEILLALLQNVQREPSVAQAFYQSFLLVLIQDTLAVMTDRLHKSGFKMHATLLRHIFHLVEGGHVTAPLFDPAAQPAGQTNPAFLREHVANLLIASFPNLTKAQVLSFVVGLFDLGTDLPTFKQHLRDFLIQLKEFSDDGDAGNAGLFDEETQARQRHDHEQQMAARLAVPGLVNPHELPVGDGDMPTYKRRAGGGARGRARAKRLSHNTQNPCTQQHDDPHEISPQRTTNEHRKRALTQNLSANNKRRTRDTSRGVRRFPPHPPRNTPPRRHDERAPAHGPRCVTTTPFAAPPHTHAHRYRSPRRPPRRRHARPAGSLRRSSRRAAAPAHPGRWETALCFTVW